MSHWGPKHWASSLAVTAGLLLPVSARAADAKLAGAYFFYWYDNRPNQPGADRIQQMTEHPPDDYLPNYTFADPDWHRRELQDLIAAKLDFILPVYFGDRTNAYWAQAGLPRLVAAADELVAAGERPPKIGMFYDTTAIEIQAGYRPNLTASSGKDLFYGFIRDYFRLVPQRHWALRDGRPIIVFYLSEYASRWDQSTFDFVYSRFAADFGVRPYLICDVSWDGVVVDGSYGWGAAADGINVNGDIAEIGPGYNDSNVPGRTNKVRPRDCGNYYEDQWEYVRTSGAGLVLIETWNEFLESTAVAPSREHGRKYVDLTARMISRWKTDNPAYPTVVFSTLGAKPAGSGLLPAFNQGDGTWKALKLGGREAAQADRASSPPSYYMYFAVADPFLHARTAELWLTVEYLDAGGGSWWIDYDSTARPYARTERVVTGDTLAWKTHTFHVTDAWFGGRQNGGADLRIAEATNSPPHYFRRVWISKSAPAGSHLLAAPVEDLVVAPGETVDIGLHYGGAAGVFQLARGPSFAQLVRTPSGRQSLRLSPRPSDQSACAIPLTLTMTGAGALDNDALRLLLRVDPNPLPRPQLAAVANAASYATGALAPGEIVTAFGTGIGPDPLAGAGLNAAGLLDTALSDTRLLFNGQPGPLVYAAPNQASAIVPYSADGSAPIEVVASRAGRRSDPLLLGVARAAPGLFSAGNTGRGQAAALNQDGSRNSPSNPAAQGSMVVLFGTGEGQTSPAGIDGKPAASVRPAPVAPLSVQIGGRDASVEYGGVAPGAVAGLLQVNARIPNDAPTGSAVPVVMTVGGVASQTGLTIAIR